MVVRYRGCREKSYCLESAVLTGRNTSEHIGMSNIICGRDLIILSVKRGSTVQYNNNIIYIYTCWGIVNIICVV